MRRWMDEQDTFQGTQPGYWYDDGQPEPSYEYGNSMVDDTGMYGNPTLAQMRAFYSVPQEIPQPDADALAQLRASYSVPQEMPQAEPAYEYGSSMVGDMARRKNPVQVSADARVSDAGRDQRMGAYDYSEAGYSPETVKYLDDMVAQRQALSDKYGEGIALNNPDYMYSRYAQDAGGADESYKVFTPEEEIRRIMASGQDASEIFDPGYNVQSWGGSRNPNQFDFVRLGAGKTYNYTDNNTGETYTASTPEQVQALTQLAKSQSGAGNNSASWSIKDSSGKEVASDTSYTPSFIKQSGQMIADSLPAVLATMALGPGAGYALSGLTAGGATAAYQGAKGASLEDSLLAGLKAGVLTGATTFASPYINSALTNAGLDFPGMSSFFPAGSPGAFDMGGAYGGSLGNVGGVESVLIGATRGAPALTGSFASGLIPASFDGGSYTNADGVEEVTQTANRLKGDPAFGTPASLYDLYNPPTGSYTNPQGVEEVEVTNTKPKDTAIPAVVPSLDAGYDTGEQLGYGNELTTPLAKDEKTPLSKYLNYASLGLTGAGLLSKAFGSGIGNKTPGAGGIGTFTPAKLPDIFSAKLPGPSGPGGPGGAGTATPYGATDPGAGGQNLTAEDYYKYGYGPEKSFFKNVPGRPIGMAKGGSTNRFAVRGPGTGRSDDIPANLSDGEYVVDAETVALLGDGSSKAGADKLDRFRVNVRKHKGKSLAAGRFSVAAKRPEVYMKGRT